MPLTLELLTMTSIDDTLKDRSQALAQAILEDADFTPAQAAAILAAIRVLVDRNPPQFPAKILRFN